MTFETEREIQIHVANHMIGEWCVTFVYLLCRLQCVSLNLEFLMPRTLTIVVLCTFNLHIQLPRASQIRLTRKMTSFFWPGTACSGLLCYFSYCYTTVVYLKLNKLYIGARLYDTNRWNQLQRFCKDSGMYLAGSKIWMIVISIIF